MTTPPPGGSALRVVFISTGFSSVLSALLASRHRVVGIVQSGPRRGRGRGTERGRAYRLASAVYSRSRPRRRPELEAFARAHGVAYHRMEQKHDVALGRWLEGLAPDVVAIYGMSWLLEERLIHLPRLGTINLHPALLPRYRGPNPWFWLYYNMDSEAGVTVHFVDAGEDTGDIIFQERFPVPLGLPMHEAQRRANEIAVRLLARALDDLAAGSCPRTPQPREPAGPRARFIRPEDHARLIDWEGWPIERVWHLLNGTQGFWNPLPPPPGWLKHFVWRIGPYSKEPASGAAGCIGRDRRGYFAAHPQGKIRLAANYDVKRLVQGLLAGRR